MSIDYRGENRWRFRVTKNGKKFETSYYSTTIPKIKNGKAEVSKEVQNAHDAYKADVQRDKIFSAERLTYNELFDMVNKQHISSLGDATRIVYNDLNTYHISKKFGNYVIMAITKFDIQKYINELKETHSARTVNLIYHIMSLVFNKAIEWEIIDKNPCRFIKLPEVVTNDYTQLLSEDEISNLMQCYENEDSTIHKLAFNLAFGCGMRMGEIIGLKLSDINFKNNSISISRQIGVVLEKGKTTVGVKKPKSKNSIRTIYAPDFVIESIKERLKEIHSIDPDVFLFSNKNGEIYTKTAIRDYFQRVLKQNNIKRIKFHDLRHLKATIMLNNGADDITVARTLGDNIATIQKTYAHTIDEVEIRAVENYEKYIHGIKSKNKQTS